MGVVLLREASLTRELNLDGIFTSGGREGAHLLITGRGGGGAFICLEEAADSKNKPRERRFPSPSSLHPFPPSLFLLLRPLAALQKPRPEQRQQHSSGRGRGRRLLWE